MGIAVQITEGDVFYLKCTLCNPPKMKYFVVAQATPLRMFIVNSVLNPFVQRNPDHLAAMALMRLAQHPWMHHDSYIACDHLSHEYNHDGLVATLADQPSIRCGHLHADAKELIKDALRGNVLLARKYLKQIRPLWGLAN